jgi:hypothetical protein
MPRAVMVGNDCKRFQKQWKSEDFLCSAPQRVPAKPHLNWQRTLDQTSRMRRIVPEEKPRVRFAHAELHVSGLM